MDFVKRFFREETGQGMAEYGLILALVAVAVIAVLGLLGDQLVAIFNDVIDGLTTGD
ncbi:MAG: Flp family type IVb pilin [Thermacetogeniaceae bacterium]|jgi:pilus assembly protein Flp/PilA|nr:Flp family type IVb pilin [Thermoanaerobacterales bacterium]NLN21686.1 Flp family type IVb pilin [Syntrophomonadaceae bacterium]HAF17585.1 Flp family type IVb pilin [Peptococcaceae bacterium]